MLYIIFFLLFTTSLYSSTAEIKQYVETVPQDIECILAADIGGTHSSVGIFEIEDDKPKLLISLHTETKNIGDSVETMNEVLEYIRNTHGISIYHACIAAPGVATKKKDYSNVHGMFEIKKAELLEKTPLKTVFIVNDLFVVGHGLDSIDQNKIIHLYGDIPKKENKKNIRAIISAGSGIGSSTITWDSEKKEYITHAGEAGMLEFAPTTQLEFEFASILKTFMAEEKQHTGQILLLVQE